MSTTSDEATPKQPSLLNDIILHENDLTEQAKEHFSYHSEVLNVFESYRQNILRDEHMTSMGRHITLSELDKLHTDFKQVLNYTAEHSELVACKLPSFGPLFIVGLPRTGSTVLHNLLACDPNCRTTLFTDMSIEIVPPISRTDVVGQERRGIIALSSIKMDASFTTQRNRIISAHPVFPIDEDYHILRQAGFFSFCLLATSDPELHSDSWPESDTKKNYAYDYHELFLRMLNSIDAPRSHWLLKSPLHSFQLDTISGHYPNAKFIMTHRRLDEVIPSFCSLTCILGEVYIGTNNQASRNVLKKRNLQYIDKAVECIMKFRADKNNACDQSHKNMFDVNYNDLMKDPIDVVHRIYDYFGLEWSDEFEVAMVKWLRDNPQGKQGRHVYNLAECGLTCEDIEKRYMDYIKLFHCSSLQNDQLQ